MHTKRLNQNIYHSKVFLVGTVSLLLLMCAAGARIYVSHLEHYIDQCNGFNSATINPSCAVVGYDARLDSQPTIDHWMIFYLILIALTVISAALTLCMWQIKLRNPSTVRLRRLSRSFRIISFVSFDWLLGIIVINEIVKYNNNNYFLNDFSNWTGIVMILVFLASTPVAITYKLSSRKFLVGKKPAIISK